MSGFNKSRAVILAGCADFGVSGFETGSLTAAFLAGLTSGREIGFFLWFWDVGAFCRSSNSYFFRR